MEELTARMRRLLAQEPSTRAPLAARPEPLRVIRAGVGDTVRLIRLDEVIYLQATDKYVNVVAVDSEALIREPLRELLPRLDPERFAQVHRSTVVNLDYVQSASRDGSGKLWLKLREREERLAVSRLHAHLFKPM
jgi:DNA-binding LytR/AlgR family response regulator